MIILGIDPGLAIVGWGILDYDKNRFRPLAYGSINTPAGMETALRLARIHHDLSAIIDHYKPTEMAVEELFFTKNITTGIRVAEARGVILMTGQEKGLSLAEYTPMQVKQAVAGYGGAQKRQVQLMTQRLLGMKEVPKPDDAADALALAICHGRAATSLLNTERVFDAAKYNTT